MANLSDIDWDIFREKKRSFRGSFKIPLEKLRAEDSTRDPRLLSEAVVKTLVERFQQEGTLRHEPQNHVPALISQCDLPSNEFRVDTLTNVSEENPRDPPIFCIDQVLIVLTGKHRLEAARRFLIPSERWWIVDLYSDDLSPQVQDVLRYGVSASTRYSQGEIVRQIRISTLNNDEKRQQKWMLELNKNQRKNLSRLNAMPDFLASLDKKITFFGLWAEITIGTFDSLARLHCPEELTHYSDRITETWTYILGNNEDDQLRLDPCSVNIMRGRCPWRSSQDRAYIQSRMQSRELLPTITSHHQRAGILDRICSVPHLIPPFFTLLEDSKALGPPMKILRQLLPLPQGRSISQQFAALHEGQENLLIQTSEFNFEERPTPSASCSSWISYRQLALAAFRHSPVMGGTLPRIDKIGERLMEYGEQNSWWCEIFALGSRLGYKGLLQKYPDHKAANVSIIKDCLHRTQPARYYVTDPKNDDRVVQLISQVLVDKPRRTQMQVTPEIVSDIDDCGWDIKHRCGRPYEQSFLADQSSLFYDYVYSATYPSQGQYMTSFGVKRDMFQAFFGTMPEEFRAGLSRPAQKQDHLEDLAETTIMDGPGGEQPLVRISRPLLPVETASAIERRAPESTFPNTQRRSYFTVASQYSLSPTGIPASAGVRSPLDFTEFSVGPWPSQATNTRQEIAPIYVFGQQNADGDVTLKDASRLLSHRQKGSKSSPFTVLSPTINGRFRKRYADPMDKFSMVSALNLSSRCYFVAQSNGKRLKMAAPVTVLEEARLDRLHAVVAVPRQKIPDLIHQFENQAESDEEL